MHLRYIPTMAAGRKRAFSSSSNASDKQGTKKATTPFLVPVEDSDNEGKVTGVLCSLCMKHKTDQRNHAGT